MHPFFQDYSFFGFVHRGGDEVETENTIEAFKYSSDLGFVFIETDVQATKDGHVVIFHDATLKRMAGVNKSVKELIPYLKNDKKNDDKKINFILLKSIGKTAQPNENKINLMDLKKFSNLLINRNF